jgi:hypothetical protein
MATMTPVYGERYYEALAYAAELHRTQPRKAEPGVESKIPYIAHLLEVSALVWTHGGDETQAIAALLHDSLEDQFPTATPQILEDQFGAEVREIVENCTDGKLGAGRKNEPYIARKARYLAHLYSVDERSLVVSMADKVSNAQAILTDLLINDGSESFWLRFNNPRQAIGWYYSEFAQAARHRMPAHGLVKRLDNLAVQVVEAAGGTDLEAAYPDESPRWIARHIAPLSKARTTF